MKKLSWLGRKIQKRIRLKFSDEVVIKKIEELAITPTMKCCLNCAMCHQKEIKHWPNMPYSDFEKMLINLKKEGVKKVSLVGGEIFVHPEMWKFVELMERMDFQYDLSSNLFFVPGGVEKFSKLKGLEMITTSIDGIGELHDKIRGVSGAFNRTSENIKKIIKMRIPIDVACVLQKANLKELEEIVKYIIGLNIKSITILVENNLTEAEQKLNKKIIEKVAGRSAEILISAKKNPFGTMNNSDWEIAQKKIKNLQLLCKNNHCQLNLATQLIYPELFEKNANLKNYTCGIFKGYNMIAYNQGELPFCGFIKLAGEDYSLIKKTPIQVANSTEYIKLRKIFKQGGALPMCRMCCALKRK